MKYYVYAHYTKDGHFEHPFYIGKGTGNRCYVSYKRNEFWKRISKSHGVDVVILKYFSKDSEEQAYQFEIEMIYKYKILGGCQCNFTIGGDGVRVLNRWWNEKISASLKGKKRPSGEESKSYKSFTSKDILVDLYTNKGLNTIEIGKMFGVSYGTVATRLKEFGIKSRSAGRIKNKIICKTNGVVYASISDAARKLDLYRENINKVLSGKYKHTGGYYFETIKQQ